MPCGTCKYVMSVIMSCVMYDVAYLLGRGDSEGKAVNTGGSGHESLGLLGVGLGEEPDHDGLALRLEGLSLLHGGDRLNQHPKRQGGKKH